LVWQGRNARPGLGAPKAGEVFRFLLLQPEHAAAREAVLEALWPDQDAAAAHTQLHQATSALRRLLEPDLPDKFPSRYLEVGAQRLALRLPPGSTRDWVDFEQARRKRWQLSPSPTRPRPPRLFRCTRAGTLCRPLFSSDCTPTGRAGPCWLAAAPGGLLALAQAAEGRAAGRRAGGLPPRPVR
jgi:hypothetical protein